MPRPSVDQRKKRVVDRDLWRAPGGPLRQPRITMRLMWGEGVPLEVGHWLCCDSPRARAAYKVVKIPKGLSHTEYRPVVCERWRIHEISEGAAVHRFTRHRRKPRPGGGL